MMIEKRRCSNMDDVILETHPNMFHDPKRLLVSYRLESEQLEMVSCRPGGGKVGLGDYSKSFNF